MRPHPRTCLTVGLLASLIVACAGPGSGVGQRAVDTARDGLDTARSTLEDLSDDARFCLAVTRAVTAIESGSPATAEEAAEEVLAQAPDELTEEARGVVDELRRVRDGDADLRGAGLSAAVDQLREAAAPRCDPG